MSEQNPPAHLPSLVEPVGSAFLLRRVLPVNALFDSRLTPSLKPAAFLPRPPNTKNPRMTNGESGISFSYEYSLSKIEFLSAIQVKEQCSHFDQRLRDGCGVYAVTEEQVQSEIHDGKNALLVDRRSNKDSGHYVVEEASWQEWIGENRAKILEWATRLSFVAVERIRPAKQ